MTNLRQAVTCISVALVLVGCAGFSGDVGGLQSCLISEDSGHYNPHCTVQGPSGEFEYFSGTRQTPDPNCVKICRHRVNNCGNSGPMTATVDYDEDDNPYVSSVECGSGNQSGSASSALWEDARLFASVESRDANITQIKFTGEVFFVPSPIRQGDGSPKSPGGV